MKNKAEPTPTRYVLSSLDTELRCVHEFCAHDSPHTLAPPSSQHCSTSCRPLNVINRVLERDLIFVMADGKNHTTSNI